MIAPPVDDLWALELAKARQAAGDGAASSNAGYWPSAILALAGWAKAVLTAQPGDRLPEQAPVLAALHGEITNRTRHLIAALAADAPETPILLLGRPQASVAEIRTAFAGLGLPAAALVRPVSLWSGLASLPAVLGRLWEGATAVRGAAWRPPPRDLAAICFRVLLGETMAHWAGRSFSRASRTVVFGHTGTADSQQLEAALQKQGARTLHWVHGVSLGLNFVAGSDVGLFQSGSDASWHQALGGYGAALSLPASAPVMPMGGEGWLVLSNLVHPMNADYRRQGVAGEAALLATVASAAAEAGQTRLVWKPHPVLRDMPVEVREKIEGRASELGFERWPHDDRDLGPAADFELIITTPSTVAIDVLRLGRLPLIHGATGLDPMSAIARFPLHTANATEISAAARRLSSGEERQSLFEAAWAAVAPGRNPSLSDILALVERQADR